MVMAKLSAFSYTFLCVLHSRSAFASQSLERHDRAEGHHHDHDDLLVATGIVRRIPSSHLSRVE
jgi:hypothetical protein